MKTFNRAFIRLLGSQAQVAFNDNATKLALMGVAQLVLSPSHATTVISLLSFLVVIPFVLLAPISGWICDRFAKRDVILGSLAVQLGVMAILLMAISFKSVIGLLFGFFLLGVQATVMAPAKRGLVKELVPTSGIASAIGVMEMLSIVSVLGGSVCGGKLIDTLVVHEGSPWKGAMMTLLILTTACVVAFLVFFGVTRHPAADPESRFQWKLVIGHFAQLRELHRYKGLFRAASGDALFYFIGGVLFLTMAQIGRELFPKGIGAASETGYMMACLGGGIAAGSLAASRICRNTIRLGLLPIAAFGMGVLLFLMPMFHPHTIYFFALLAGLGIFGGLYLVPISAWLVSRSPETSRGRILAASGLLSSLTGILATGVYWVLSQGLHFSTSMQFVFLGVIALFASVYILKLLPDEFLRLVALTIARIHYPVTAYGEDALPESGGALILCNHVTYVDTLALSLASNRPIRFLSHEGLFSVPIVGDVLRIFGCIPVSPTHAKDALRKASNAIKAGELVCIFPEGALTRTGTLMPLRSGFEIIARLAKCPVVVAQIDGLWGSIFSFAGGRFFRKIPKRLRFPLRVSFAKVDGEKVSITGVRDAFLHLGAEAFYRRPNLKTSIAKSFVGALKMQPWKTQIIDWSEKRRCFSRAEIFAASVVLGRRWRKEIPESRVGILLPPGFAGTVAHIALTFAGKIPVHLNPTLSPEAAAHVLKQAELQTVITVPLMQKKFTRFPWPQKVVDIREALGNMPRGSVLRWWLRLFVYSPRLLNLRLNFPEMPKSAAVLFTSGSSGLPKGVEFSSSNLLGNVEQVREIQFLRKNDRLLASLPLFHSFGFTMGLLYPLLDGVLMITIPSPLDCGKLSEASIADSPTVLMTTPTFLRSYLRHLTPAVFSSMRLIFTGAERLPDELVAGVKEKFRCQVFEGYGMTEASPVVAANLPDPIYDYGKDVPQHASRPSSVGRLLPGLAAKLIPMEGDTASHGILALRGCNMVSKYLNETDQSEKFQDGWYITGDIARVDVDGFLFIEGRSSRFSKIGGEMVSHRAVEEAIARVINSEEDVSDCVIGIPDEEKGEKLVLITTRKIEQQLLGSKLREAEIPNLWIPRKILQVDSLFLLESGKIDIAACKNFAMSNPASTIPT
ncbi:MAG: MFS transporter [Chthoniobacterales bacterium]